MTQRIDDAPIGHRMTPSPDRIRSLLEYNPTTGLFRWRNPSCRQSRGWFKGNKSVRSYRRLYIAGRHYLAHVIAWVIVKGAWPSKKIGHKDRNQANNKWLNLRLGSHGQHCFNRRINKNTSTGFRGVSRFGEDQFRARMIVRRRHISLGLFDTPQAASVAWKKAAKKHYEGFANVDD